MIRYDVALAIIGILVTVMGILIAFEIAFASEFYFEEYTYLKGARMSIII